MKLYHYTDKEGYDGIKRDGVIRQSHGRVKGRGVYLTDMDPTTDRDEVAQSNYGNGADRHRKKTDHCFVVNLPEGHHTLMRFERHKWVYFGDIPESMIEWSDSGPVSSFTVGIVAVAAIGAAALLYSMFSSSTQEEEDKAKGTQTKRNSSQGRGW